MKQLLLRVSAAQNHAQFKQKFDKVIFLYFFLKFLDSDYFSFFLVLHC